MPRRMIDSALWVHPVLCRMPIAARAMFAGLITLADDEGWTLGSPEDIRRQILPNARIGNGKIQSWLDDLEAAGMLRQATTKRLASVPQATSKRLATAQQATINGIATDQLQHSNEIASVPQATSKRLATSIGCVVNYCKLTAFDVHQHLSRPRKSRRIEEKRREEEDEGRSVVVVAPSDSGEPEPEAPKATTVERPDETAVGWLCREYGFGQARARALASSTGVSEEDLPAWDAWRRERPAGVVVAALKGNRRPPGAEAAGPDPNERRNREFAENRALAEKEAAPPPAGMLAQVRGDPG